MLVQPTHTVDGRALTPAEREREAARFLVWVDAPGHREVTVEGPPLCRFRGWAISPGSNGLSARIRVADGPTLPVAFDRERADVLEQVAADFPDAELRCGFDAPVDIREIGTKPMPVVLEVADDHVVARAEFRITRRERPVAPRGDYKSVWNAVSDHEDHAKVAVSGFTDEDTYRELADVTVAGLQGTVGLGPDDVVLEIGCGVGRVGPAIAPLVKTWIAADVSENMLEHVRERLQGFDNVETVALNGWDLSPIASESVDVVYCTVVFMHLDEWDRFGYVREAMRVLRPGGRLYVDNFNLLSEVGWAFFMETLEGYHPLERPPNISKSSTPTELQAYLERVGFEQIQVLAQPDSMWVFCWGRKPSAG